MLRFIFWKEMNKEFLLNIGLFSRNWIIVENGLKWLNVNIPKKLIEPYKAYSGAKIVCEHAKLLHLCPTLWDPMDCSPSRILYPMGFSRQEYWSGLPRPPVGDLPNPGIEPVSLRSPALAGVFFITSLADVERSFCSVLISLCKHINTHTYRYC